MDRKYKALRLISSISNVSGWIYIIVGILIFFFEIGSSGNENLSFKESTILIIGCFLVGLFSIGSAELIKLFIDIEHNTRQLSNSNKKVYLEEKISSIPQQEDNVLNITQIDILSLHELIVEQKKKFMPGRNIQIPEILKKVVTDMNSGKSLLYKYEMEFDKDLIEDLISLSSRYDIIQYYIEPLIEIGLCDQKFPHKILN